jgi:hypothetical protein
MYFFHPRQQHLVCELLPNMSPEVTTVQSYLSSTVKIKGKKQINEYIYTEIPQLILTYNTGRKRLKALSIAYLFNPSKERNKGRMNL